MIIDAGAPRLARELEYLAAAAVHLLRQREAHYPRLIEAGKLKQTDAVEKLELAHALVDQWKWANDREAGPIDWDRFDPNGGVFGPPNWQMRLDIAAAAERQRALADHRPGDSDARELADLYAALAWWQEDVGGIARIVMETDVHRRVFPRPTRLREAA